MDENTFGAHGYLTESGASPALHQTQCVRAESGLLITERLGSFPRISAANELQSLVDKLSYFLTLGFLNVTYRGVFW